MYKIEQISKVGVLETYTVPVREDGVREYKHRE